MGLMKKKTLDLRQFAKERNLAFLDLSRKLELILQAMSDTSKLHEQAKLERNRKLNTIETSKQLKVEFNEKIRIMDSETELLRKEIAVKDG
jgi:hypothetical protein